MRDLYTSTCGASLLLMLGCTPTGDVKVGPGRTDSGQTDSGAGHDSVDSGDSADDSADSAADSDDTPRDTAIEVVPGETWSAPIFDIDAIPDDVPTVNILIDAAAMARLDADPYHADDEAGSFIDDDGVTHTVALHYRGAYALKNVMTSYDLRNWKVKFEADDPYLDRREWNFNYEPSFRQQLAHDLLRFSGVPVPEGQHVVLQINGVYKGVYYQYSDPDNKSWLYDNFGDDGGDLYKTAYDLPGEPQCWADLTFLGDDDSDYICHYTKKTNNETAPEDVAVVREFLDNLNNLDDDEFAAWVDEAVDIDALLSYLVVSDFIANWDSYPQRPKNYWLYADPRAARMVLIPWDMDGTFSPSTDSTYNKMGTTASVLYNLEKSEYAPVHSSEGTERPLVRRLFARDTIKAAYLTRYAELTESILSDDYLDARLTALHDQIEPYASATDKSRLSSDESTVRSFISARTSKVEAELSSLGY